jgi:hypothetical protein
MANAFPIIRAKPIQVSDDFFKNQNAIYSTAHGYACFEQQASLI